MPLKIFLKVDGIDGESREQGHVNEIDVLSFNFGTANTAGTGTGSGGGGAGKTVFQNISVAKTIDKASPGLFLACATGRHISQCILTVKRAVGLFQPILITLADCTIVSTDDSVAHGGDAGHETIAIGFSIIHFQYTPLKADGTADTPVVAGWNLKTNTPA